MAVWDGIAAEYFVISVLKIEIKAQLMIPFVKVFIDVDVIDVLAVLRFLVLDILPSLIPSFLLLLVPFG
jgi:hypothetical protein